MPKFGVVESRVCGAGIGFRVAGKGFWDVGWVRVLGCWVDAVLGVGNAGVLVLEMKSLCR